MARVLPITLDKLAVGYSARLDIGTLHCLYLQLLLLCALPGMAHVLPITLDKLGVGQRVTVEVGERLRLDDLTCKCGVGSMEEQQQVG